MRRVDSQRRSRPPRRRLRRPCRGRNEGQGTAEVSERQAAERRGHTAGEVADELDEVTVRTVKMVASFSDAVWAGQAGGGYELTVGQAMEAFGAARTFMPTTSAPPSGVRRSEDRVSEAASSTWPTY